MLDDVVVGDVDDNIVDAVAIDGVVVILGDNGNEAVVRAFVP